MSLLSRKLNKKIRWKYMGEGLIKDDYDDYDDDWWLLPKLL